jgi:hypothetical protein
MSYLTCPTCRFTVSESGARSPFQNCPRCLLRHQTAVTMQPVSHPPTRFGRGEEAVQRIAEAKSRLRPRARDADLA